MAGADASLTPVVDCVVPQRINATTNKVYFGYTNPGVEVSVPFGETNQIVPGIPFQGQPTVFNTGTYERVFAASWNPTAFMGLSWEFNNLTATADSRTPVCVAGITGTASDVTLSTASLNGDVDIGGQGTTYHFRLVGHQQRWHHPGPLATFTTLAPPPPPTTVAATTTVTTSTTVTAPATTTNVTVTGTVPTAGGTSKLTLSTAGAPATRCPPGLVAARCPSSPGSR
jgi:hypothetical protein